MEVQVREAGGVNVVSVVGELTNLTSVAFFNRVVAMRRQSGTRIVLDLRGLTYLDSTGAGQLWRTVESARTEGGAAVLAAVPPMARKVLDLLGMSKELVIAESVDDAVKSLSAQPGPHPRSAS